MNFFTVNEPCGTDWVLLNLWLWLWGLFRTLGLGFAEPCGCLPTQDIPWFVLKSLMISTISLRWVCCIKPIYLTPLALSLRRFNFIFFSKKRVVKDPEIKAQLVGCWEEAREDFSLGSFLWGKAAPFSFLFSWGKKNSPTLHPRSTEFLQCFEKSNHSCNPNSQSLWNVNILAAKTPFSAVFTPLTPQVSCRGRAQGGKGLSAEGSPPAASRELLATGLFPGKPAASLDLSVLQAPKGKRFFSLAVSMDRIEQIPAQERFFPL